MIKRPSIKKVAKEAGVSPATVSLVFNGKGRISPKTQERVRDAANRLGFILDGTAARLRSGRSRLIGLVVNDISNPFFAELAGDVETEVAARGYLPIIANSRNEIDQQRKVVEAMIGQGIAGLIVSATDGTNEEALASARQHGIPYVLCVRDVEDFHAGFVGFDNHRAGVIAAEHLRARGHERVAFIGGMVGSENRNRRLQGVADVFADAGHPISDELIASGPATREFGLEAATRVLMHSSHPTALVCFNDYVALGAYEGVRRSGRSVGPSVNDEIGIIGFDNVAASPSWNPPLTTVELYPRAIGRRAARALLASIEEDDHAAERTYLMPTLLVRGSS